MRNTTETPRTANSELGGWAESLVAFGVGWAESLVACRKQLERQWKIRKIDEALLRLKHANFTI